MAKYSLNKEEFFIEDYNKAKSFCSFLPAISGKFGLPLWCFYVNRAQGVVSLGVKDKDHSLLEFLPANKSLFSVFYQGFRTFLKIDSNFYEPFRIPRKSPLRQVMKVSSSFLEIEEENKKRGLDIRVRYFTLPSSDFASLVRIVELKNTLIKTHALRLPRLDLELLAKRQSQYVNRVVPKNLGLSFQKEREIVDIFTLSVPASYELDLWGRLSGAEDAVRAQILEAEENRKTIIQSLIAEAVSLYLQIKAKDEELRIEKERVKNYKKSLLLVESRFKRGLCDILELRQARRALAASEAMIPKLNEELGDLEQRLSILLGRYPKTGDFSKRSYWNYLKTLRPVPPGLPSQLLLRRPDIRAAQARLKALSAMVGVSRASRFPRITLTGNMGYASEELHRLFTPQSYLWSLAIGIIRPIFDGNRLKAEQKEAEIRYREGLTQYAETVLKAFYEVESALLRRKKLLERRERLFTLLKEAMLTEEVAVSRYRRGLIDFLTVLEAKQ